MAETTRLSVLEWIKSQQWWPSHWDFPVFAHRDVLDLENIVRNGYDRPLSPEEIKRAHEVTGKLWKWTAPVSDDRE